MLSPRLCCWLCTPGAGAERMLDRQSRLVSQGMSSAPAGLTPVARLRQCFPTPQQLFNRQQKQMKALLLCSPCRSGRMALHWCCPASLPAPATNSSNRRLRLPAQLLRPPKSAACLLKRPYSYYKNGVGLLNRLHTLVIAAVRVVLPWST